MARSVPDGANSAHHQSLFGVITRSDGILALTTLPPERDDSKKGVALGNCRCLIAIVPM